VLAAAVPASARKAASLGRAVFDGLADAA